MSEPILETQGLYKFYGSASGKVPVVNDVSLSVPEGRLVAVMGPSGSGKSTLLHMVSGLEPPSGGSILLAGHELQSMTEKERTLLRRDLVGFVFQFYNLVPNLTVEDNIRLPLLIGARPERFRGRTSAGRAAGASEGGDGAGAAATATVTDAAASPGASELDPDAELRRLSDAFGLGHVLDRYPHQLSGGEMQRSSIARALITRPAIVMADEPTGNISVGAGEDVMKLFRRSCDEFGQTILLVTHNARDAAFADEVHFLRDGELHEERNLQGDRVTPENIAAALAALGI